MSAREPVGRFAGAALRVLIIDADARALAEALEAAGHAAVVAGDGRDGFAAAAREPFDAAVIGSDFTNADGLAALRALRDGGMTLPVLILGASARTVDAIESLESGADDYVVKPAEPALIAARLKALVRARRLGGAGGDTIAAGDIVMSPAHVRAWRSGEPLELGWTEFRLLAELVRAKDGAVSKARLIESVWGADHVPTTNIVEANIRRLRIKLMQHGDDPIRTVRGVGYWIRA